MGDRQLRQPSGRIIIYDKNNQRIEKAKFRYRHVPCHMGPCCLGQRFCLAVRHGQHDRGTSGIRIEVRMISCQLSWSVERHGAVLFCRGKKGFLTDPLKHVVDIIFAVSKRLPSTGSTWIRRRAPLRSTCALYKGGACASACVDARQDSLVHSRLAFLPQRCHCCTQVLRHMAPCTGSRKRSVIQPSWIRSAESWRKMPLDTCMRGRLNLPASVPPC